MTDDSIEAVIDAVNSGSYEDWIFLWEIDTFTKAAKVWPKQNLTSCEREEGFDFLLIYNEDQQCIAANFEMDDEDLHIFVKPEHRRKGVATSALKNVVLPWVFFKDPDRNHQCVSFRDDFVERMLLKTGFEICSEQKAQIFRRNCNVREFKPKPRMPITNERKNEMKQEIALARSIIGKVRSEIGGRFTEEFTDEIDWSISNLLPLENLIEDEWFKYSRDHSYQK